MKCIQVQLRLSAFLDGEVSPVETDEIKSHLAQCPDCRKIADEFSLVYNMISVWKPHQRNVSLKFVKPATSPRLDIFRWLAAAACFVGLFAGGFLGQIIWNIKETNSIETTSPSDEIIHAWNLDVLGEWPRDSVEDVYMKMTALNTRGGNGNE